jgi:hypothetical protein
MAPRAGTYRRVRAPRAGAGAFPLFCRMRRAAPAHDESLTPQRVPGAAQPPGTPAESRRAAGTRRESAAEPDRLLDVRTDTPVSSRVIHEARAGWGARLAHAHTHGRFVSLIAARSPPLHHPLPHGALDRRAAAQLA